MLDDDEPPDSLRSDYVDFRSGSIEDIIGVVVYVKDTPTDTDDRYLLIANPYGDVVRVKLDHKYQTNTSIQKQPLSYHGCRSRRKMSERA